MSDVSKDSNIHHTSFLRQKKFLDGILETIKTDHGSVTEELYEIIRTLAKPENVFLYLATNAEELIKHFGSGLPLLQTLFNASSEMDKSKLSERFSVKAEHEYRKADEDVLPRHVAFGVGGTESCYLKQSIFYNNADWTHSEVSFCLEHFAYLLCYHAFLDKSYSLLVYAKIF